jgi:hypothetical protein
MTFSLLCLVALGASLWATPEAVVVQAELAPFLQEGDTGVPAQFEDVIGVLRRSSAPIKNYLVQCDKLAWQELPFAQPITLPQTPLNVHASEGQTNYLFGALRLYLAQRLVQARLFDEAKKVMEDLTPENSIDPAGVLILKAVVFHHFSNKDEGLAALKDFRAVAEREKVSRRATELAKLLQFEWEQRAREEETQQISRQMDDVRRRLGQGRTGEDTQETEGDVLQALDQLIERIEQQSQRQRSERNGQQDPSQPKDPAEESRNMALKAPGNVDRRDFAQGDKWGDLPPKEREEALLKIEKEFPPYYRDIIERYFQEMAK